jgi:hypothetical protein
MTDPLGDTAEDAGQWWLAYQLAENDQAEALRERAEAGDEHARRQLASWLADRGYTGGSPDRAKLGKAIEVIRPLADAGDDVAGLWLARWLADLDQVEELRQRAASGSFHAVHELAEWLAWHERLDELRQLMVDHWELLAGWRARQHHMDVRRLAAELGDDDARLSLERGLARLRERAASGHEHARRSLDELARNPDWLPFLASRPD